MIKILEYKNKLTKLPRPSNREVLEIIHEIYNAGKKEGQNYRKWQRKIR